MGNAFVGLYFPFLSPRASVSTNPMSIATKQHTNKPPTTSNISGKV
jgi:hypothetical protein